MVNGGIQQNQTDGNHCLDNEQLHHGNQGQNRIADETQLQVGNKVYQEQGNNLSDDQINPAQLAEHGTVRILKNQIGQQTVDTHQNIFALVRKGRHFIALFPDQIVNHRQNENLQQRFRHPQKSLCIFICTTT